MDRYFLQYNEKMFAGYNQNRYQSNVLLWTENINEAWLFKSARGAFKKHCLLECYFSISSDIMHYQNGIISTVDKSQYFNLDAEFPSIFVLIKQADTFTIGLAIQKVMKNKKIEDSKIDAILTELETATSYKNGRKIAKKYITLINDY